jgi:hypothetical protein
MIDLELACQQAGVNLDLLVRLCERRGFDPLEVVRDEFDGRFNLTDEQKAALAEQLKQRYGVSNGSN